MMPHRLVEAMREVLEGWQADLPMPWREVLDDVALGFGDMDEGLVLEPWEPIFPARRVDFH
jgi:uracil-DNA glycosylase